MTRASICAQTTVPGRLARLPALQASPGYLIRVAQQVHTGLWRRELRGVVTSIQYACLLAIGNDPMLDQRTLGTRVSLDKATVADVVRRMVNTGLIHRVQSAEDRRRRLLELTSHGHQVRQDFMPAVLRVQDEILAPLDAGQRPRLLHSLTKLVGPIDRDNVVRLNRRTTLHSAPGHLIRRAQQRHSLLWTDIVGTDVTSVQYGVLLGLHGSPPLSQVTIGALVSLDKSSIADVLARLEGRGLVHRAPDDSDGRRNLVEVTDEGGTVVGTLAPQVLEVQDLLFDPLDRSERNSFTHLMTLVCRINR